MAVQHTPSPRLGPVGQIGDDTDHLDNQPSTSTVNSQVDDRQEAGHSRRGPAQVASLQQHMTKRLLRLPPFWKNDPGLWFAQVEARFHIHKINSDEDRFYTIIAAIEEPSVLAQVSDCVRNPPARDKYQSFKTQLTACFSDSKERQLHRLLTELTLDDKKPSQLLREMRRLAPHGISEDVLHSLWMKRMPISVRCVLSASEGDELTKLAENACRILDHSTQPQVMAMGNPRSEPITSSRHPVVYFSEERLANVEKYLSEHATTVKSIQTSLKTTDNPSERRARYRTRTTTPPGEKICRFHRKFGNNAQRCLLPCRYKSSEPSEN
jgi:hypothetical protein